MEMVIALSIMIVILTAILPLFGQIRSGWESSQTAADTMQNGRILIDHLNHNLVKAVKVTAVSDASQTDGYIEFENNDSEAIRYDVNGTSGYVEFGPVGDLCDLAGPVSRLQFTCFDACDLDSYLSPVSDVNIIRAVRVEATVTDSSSSARNKTFTTIAYLRTNGNSGSGSGSTTQTTYDYSNRIQETNIFAYDGEDNVQVPASSATPTNALGASQYDDIEFDDGTFHSYSVSSNSKYAQMRFVFLIDENESDVTQITAVFNGKGINTKKNDTDGASFYIWNDTYLNYELLEASADTESEVTLTGTLLSSLTDYIGGAGANTIILLAVSNSKKPNKESMELFTDYVKLEVTETSGSGGIYP